MKIRHKLFAGLVGIPVIFAGVAVFLILTNRQVEGDAHEVATYELNLESRAVQLPAAFISGQKAAEELLAAQRRMLLEPEEKNLAEEDARKARAAILKNKARVNEILDFLTLMTQRSVNEYRQEGLETEAAAEAEELAAIKQIRVQTLRYHQFLDEYLAATGSRPDHADEVLSNDVRQQYEKGLAPLVQSYADSRYEETSQKASGIEQHVRKLSRLVAGSALGAFLFAILIAVFLSHSISQPLKDLTAAAREIGKGHLGSKIPITSRDGKRPEPNNSL
jgi:nitrogen fixation/metabolism regulation signal transduction histidine kinase